MTIVPVSDWLADLTRASILGGNDIRRIYNGIDTELFKPTGGNDLAPAAGTRPVKILGCANVWCARKGLADFLKLRERFPETELEITLVGLTQPQIDALPKGIRGIRRTKTQWELAELYSGADLYITTSIEETFGMTVAEALSCGTPAVVYRSSALPELVTPETGFVVPAGDIDGICAAIETMRSRGKIAYFSACRSRAVEEFSAPRRFGEYLALYEECRGSREHIAT